MHFIAYTNMAHPSFTLLSAPTLRIALRKYVLEDLVSLDKSGGLVFSNGKRIVTRYAHELEAIECDLKVGNRNFTIRALDNSDWRAPIAHVFHGLGVPQNRKLAALCRQQFPNDAVVHRNTFVWELNSGHLLTFYRKKRWVDNSVNPNALGARFLISHDDPSRARRWTGDYDDILADMKLH